MPLPNFPEWYPTDVDEEIDFDSNESPYGKPEPAILAVVKKRLQTIEAKILDVAGGDGRYALALAKEGHNVTVTDIDSRALEAAQRRAEALPQHSGNVTTVQVDVLSEQGLDQFRGQGFDASLNAAFLYLAPPEIAKDIFRRTALALRIGGLAIIQFSTNLERMTKEGKSLIGREEYLYSEDEGRKVLSDMYDETGFEGIEFDRFTIHQEDPYLLHTDVLVASGVKGSEHP
jgi:16S rRNA G966 N2-methylase RsmD